MQHSGNVIPIIFVLDSSGSMAEEKIEAVNEAMQELKNIYCELNENLRVYIGVLSFSIGFKWHTTGLVDIGMYEYTKMIAHGLTDIGSAIEEIGKRLTRSDLLANIKGNISKPIIIFMSDGLPTDEWEKKLKKAEHDNPWFRNATRIPIAIGNDCDISVMARLERAYEHMDADGQFVLFAYLPKANNAEQLKNYLISIFKNSISDGYSKLTDDSVAKTARIINGIGNDNLIHVDPIENDDTWNLGGDDTWE